MDGLLNLKAIPEYVGLVKASNKTNYYWQQFSNWHMDQQKG